MSETLWPSEATLDAQPEGEEAQAEDKVSEEEAVQEPRALTVSVTDFAGLEDRVLRAVSMVKQERQARTEAEERAERAEGLLSEQIPRIEQMQAELAAMRTEREQVKSRVDRLLEQLDALEL